MKMKTNVQYIANATFAKLPDVRCKRNGRHNNHRQADNLTEKVNHFDE